MLIRQYIVSFLAFTLIGIAWGQTNFLTVSYQEGVQLAKESKKYLLIKFYADQCPACKLMDENVFSDARVSEFIEKGYIAIKSHSGSIEGKKLQSRLKIQMLPTIVIIDPENQTELARLEGKKSLEFMLSFLDNAEKGDFSGGDPKPQDPPSDFPRRDVLIEGRIRQS